MFQPDTTKEFKRQDRRRVFLRASVPFWRRKIIIVLVLGILSFLTGFMARNAQAAGGSLQYVIECVQKSPNTGASTAPCVTVGATRYAPSMTQAYVIDPAYQTAYEDWIARQSAVDALVTEKPQIDTLVAGVTPINWLVANQSAIQNVLNNQSTLTAQSFDPVVAGQFFGWGFTGLMLVGCAAWGAGSLLGFMDRVLK